MNTVVDKVMLTHWCWKSIIVDVQCGGKKTTRWLKSSPRTCQVMMAT